MPMTRNAFARCCGYLLLALALFCPSIAPAKPAARGTATVYFIHPTGILPNMTSAEIKINGRTVGALKEGTYFVRPVPAGAATFAVKAGLMDFGFETQMTVMPGRSYYIGVNLPRSVPIGQQALQSLFYGDTGGTQLANKGFMPNRTLNLLDEPAGRAAIAKLRRVP